jgi:cardiolipin synthase
MAGGDETRVWTLPNILSLARLAGMGLFCYLLFETSNRIAAGAVLAVTGITDFLDGYIARRFNQVTNLGKILDPTADRVVVVTAGVSVVVYGAVPVWLGVVVLAREALVSGAVLLLAALGARRIDVIWAGKAGTFGLMCCIPLFIGADGPGAFAHDLRIFTYVCVVPALALAWYAAIRYIPEARKALREGRASSPAGPDAPAPAPSLGSQQ